MKGLKEIPLPIVGGAIVGTIGAHAIYRGVGTIFARGGQWMGPLAEMASGMIILLIGKAPFVTTMGAVMIGQGLLDLAYVGKLIAVEL